MAFDALRGKKVEGGWRRQHNEELRNLYVSSTIIRVIKSGRKRLEGHVARMGKMRNAYSILDGKSEGKRPVRIPRRRCKDDIILDLRKIGWEDVHWMHLA